MKIPITEGGKDVLNSADYNVDLWPYVYYCTKDVEELIYIMKRLIFKANKAGLRGVTVTEIEVDEDVFDQHCYYKVKIKIDQIKAERIGDIL